MVPPNLETSSQDAAPEDGEKPSTSSYSDVIADGANFQFEVTRGEQPKEDMLMELQPYHQVEHQLSAAPLCICVLGAIYIAGTGRDFSLEDPKRPDIKWAYLDRPDSFKASLCQVGQEGYNAFLAADKAMPTIRNLTATIPHLMKTFVKFLHGATPRELKGHLPILLEDLRDIPAKCIKEAAMVEAAFSRVISVMHELQRALSAKQGQSEKAKERAEFEAQQAQKDLAFDEKIKEDMDKKCRALEKELEKAVKDYDKALEAVPGGGALFGMALADSMCSVVLPTLAMTTFFGVAGKFMSSTEFLATGAAAAYGAKSMFEGGGSAEAAAPEAEDAVRQDSSLQDCQLYRIAAEINTHVSVLDMFFEVSGDATVLDDEIIQGLSTPKILLSAKEFDFFLDSRNRSIQEELKQGGNKTLAVNLLKICKSLKGLLKKISDASEKQNATAEEIKKFKDDLKNISEKIQNIATVESSARLNIPPTHKQGPGFGQKLKSIFKKIGGKKSLVEQHIQEAHLVVAVTTERRSSVEKQMDEATEKHRESCRRMHETMMKMNGFNAETATFAQRIEALGEGLRAFAQLKEHWTKISAFFRMMSTLIEASLGPPMKKLTHHAVVVGQDRQDGFEPGVAVKEIIYQSVYQAAKIGFLVFHLSKTYCQVSGEYLMPLVARLDTLLTYNPKTDQEEIKEAKLKLRFEAEKMQKAIENLVLDNKKQFHEQSERRGKEIDDLFDKNVAPIPEEKKAALQESVHKVMEKAKAGEELEEIDFDDYS